MVTAPGVSPHSLPADVLSALLTISLTGVIVFRPFGAPGQPEVLTDLAYVHLNPAAQLLLGLPERPAESFLTVSPHARETGLLAFYLDTFRAGTPGRYHANDSPDGLDNYSHLAAQRSGELLVVSFTVIADQPPAAPRASLPREPTAPDHSPVPPPNEAQESRVAEHPHALNALVAALRPAQAEAAQQQQQQQLRELFEQAPASVAILRGARHVFGQANAMTGKMLGFPMAELLGKSLLEVVPEAAGPDLMQLLDGVLQTGIPRTVYETPYPMLRNGRAETRYWTCVYQPLRDPVGQATGIVMVATNVTGQVLARQRAEVLQAAQVESGLVPGQPLHKRETFYQIFEQAPALIALLRGPQHRFAFYNAAYQRLFPGRGLRGRTVVEVAPELVGQGFVALLDNVYRTGITYFGTELPFVVEQPDGQPSRTHYFNFTYQRFEEDGQPAGISVFAFDVTEQVLARKERDTHRQRQQELFEQLPVAIAVFAGPDYVVEVCNPRLESLWGRTAAEVLHRPVFEAMPEVRDQGLQELLDAVRATGTPYVAHEMPVQVLLQGHLTSLYVNFVYHPLRDAQGDITAVAAVVLDVSEQVSARQLLAETNAELIAANSRLTRTNVDLDTFIYTASHDLRQPIANIEGLLSLLRGELPAPGAGLVPVLLDRMQRSVERFQLTITQLTDVSRLQQAQDQPPEAVGLAALVEDVCQDLAPALAATGTDLTVDVAAGLTVMFAPKNLRSIVYNLLSNAVKYHDPTRPPMVRLRARTTPTATVLAVQDNGLGLSPAQQRRLYGMFQRLHDHVEGSGIGLYMVKRMVENAGGTIVVQSEIGVGTTFTVTLPHPNA